MKLTSFSHVCSVEKYCNYEKNRSPDFDRSPNFQTLDYEKVDSGIPIVAQKRPAPWEPQKFLFYPMRPSVCCVVPLVTCLIWHKRGWRTQISYSIPNAVTNFVVTHNCDTQILIKSYLIAYSVQWINYYKYPNKHSTSENKNKCNKVNKYISLPLKIR
jgi:hypothetical protein